MRSWNPCGREVIIIVIHIISYQATISMLLVSRPYIQQNRGGVRWLLIINYANEPLQSVFI